MKSDMKKFTMRFPEGDLEEHIEGTNYCDPVDIVNMQFALAYICQTNKRIGNTSAICVVNDYPRLPDCNHINCWIGFFSKRSLTE